MKNLRMKWLSLLLGLILLVGSPLILFQNCSGFTSIKSLGSSSHVASAATLPFYQISLRSNATAKVLEITPAATPASCAPFKTVGFKWNIQDHINKREDTCLVEQANVVLDSWQNAYFNSPISTCSNEEATFKALQENMNQFWNEVKAQFKRPQSKTSQQVYYDMRINAMISSYEQRKAGCASVVPKSVTSISDAQITNPKFSEASGDTSVEVTLTGDFPADPVSYTYICPSRFSSPHQTNALGASTLHIYIKPTPQSEECTITVTSAGTTASTIVNIPAADASLAVSSVEEQLTDDETVIVFKVEGTFPVIPSITTPYGVGKVSNPIRGTQGDIVGFSFSLLKADVKSEEFSAMFYALGFSNINKTIKTTAVKSTLTELSITSVEFTGLDDEGFAHFKVNGTGFNSPLAFQADSVKGAYSLCALDVTVVSDTSATMKFVTAPSDVTVNFKVTDFRNMENIRHADAPFTSIVPKSPIENCAIRLNDQIASQYTFRVGERVEWRISAGKLGQGAECFWNGSKNGVEDAKDLIDSCDRNTPYSNFDGVLPAGSEGTYTRQVIYRSYVTNEIICTTPSVQITVLATDGSATPKPPVCTASVSGNTTTEGTTLHWKVDSNTPGQVYWVGTKNNVTDTGAGVYAGPAPIDSDYYYDIGTAGNYSRYAEIRDSAGKVLCRTNTLSVSIVAKSAPTNPTCSVSISDTASTEGQSSTWAISSTATGQAYWIGTKNGSIDTGPTGIFAGPAPGTYTLNYPAGSAGTYTRSAQIRNASGVVLCTTNTVTVTVTPSNGLPTPTAAPVICSLNVSSVSPKVGDTTNWQITSNLAGTAYWFGTKDGVSDTGPNGVLAGAVPGNFDITFPSGSMGAYTRYAQIRNSTGAEICRTNNVNVTVSP